MDWRVKYKDKICTASEAVGHVQSQDKIIFSDWLGESPVLTEALMARGKELQNVEIIHGMSPGPNSYLSRSGRDIFTIPPCFWEPSQDRYTGKRGWII